MTRLLIYILGPEGVGKSTQVQLLRSWLSSMGYRVKSISIRTRHLPLRLIKPFIKEYFTKACEVGTWRGASARERKLYPLLFWLETLNAVVLSMIYVILPLLLGYVVICESYVIDALTDLQRDYRRFGLSRKAFLHAARILMRLIPKRSVLIMLDANYNELVFRYKIRRSLVEPLDYIRVRRKQLLLFMKLFESYYYINTNGISPLEVFHIMKTILLKHLGDKR